MWYEKLLQNSKSRKTAVVAKLTTTTGEVYYGVNIESSCHTLSTCAERVSIYAAVTAQGPDFIIESIGIKARREGKDIAIIPCGACRQLASEFADENTTVGGTLLLELMPMPYK